MIKKFIYEFIYFYFKLNLRQLQKIDVQIITWLGNVCSLRLICREILISYKNGS